MLAASSDPHGHEPRPSDVETIAAAEIVLRSGGELDAWVDELVESSGGDADVVTLLDRMPVVDPADPHWWQDPRNTVAAVEEIRGELTAADPGGRATYRRNAARYVRRIERLDARIASCLESIPRGRRKIVTGHDSLAYFADRYGVEVVGTAIPALTTQAQPSTGETAELIDLIRDERIMAVFPEAGVATEIERAIAEETGASVGGELHADTLGPPGSAAETYLGALAANARAISAELGGDPGACEL